MTKKFISFFVTFFLFLFTSSKVFAQSTPILYTTLDDQTSVNSPVNGTGSGSAIATNPVNDFIPGYLGNGIQINSAGEYIRFAETDGITNNVELDKGTVDFWYKPNYNSNDGISHRIFSIGAADQSGSITLYKRTSTYNNDLYIYVKSSTAAGRETKVQPTSFSWTAGQWVNIRITWDSTVATGVQNVRVYLDGSELTYRSASTGPFLMPAEVSTQYIYIGSISATETLTATGILDEFKIYPDAFPPSSPTSTPTPTPTLTPTPTPTSTPTPTATPTPTQNVLTNPGFESGTLGWVKANLSGRSVVTTQFHTGTRSEQMVVSTIYPRAVYQDVPITAGVTYNIEGWIKTNALNSVGATIYIDWTNISNASDPVPSVNLVRRDTLSYISATQNWILINGSFVAPTQAVVARFTISTASEPDGIGTSWFDDLVINPVSSPQDTTPPQVSITNPVSQSTISNTITVKATATDNYGVVGVQFKVDGVNIGVEDTTSPYSILLDSTTLTEGNHSLASVARDNAGNTATATVPIIVNNTSRPNIVFIVTDDQRYDTMQYMPLTTSLLGVDSIKFNNAFVSTALCCPSRATILTGKYAHNHGIYFTSAPNGGAISFNDSSTIATWLSDTGYKTALLGKYLNGYNLLSPYIPPGWSEWHAFVKDSTPEPYYNYQINHNGVIQSYGSAATDYSTDVLASVSAQIIQNNPTNQPLFLYVAPFAPHYPFTPAPYDIGTFSNFPNWRPVSYNEADVSDKPQWVKNLPLIDPATALQGDLNHQMQLESLQAVDRLVQLIINTLSAKGILNNTIIFFTSDNGLSWGEHRFLDDKVCVYEECSKVPLWIKVPAVSPRIDNNLVENIDFAPTIADFAGVPVPAGVNGTSMVNLLSDSQTSWRSELLLEGWGHYGALTNLYGFKAVRSGQYTYAEYNNGDKELYDLTVDPFQMNNVVNDPFYLVIKTQLQNSLNILKNQ